MKIILFFNYIDLPWAIASIVVLILVLKWIKTSLTSLTKIKTNLEKISHELTANNGGATND